MEHSGTSKATVDIQTILDQIGGDRALLREVIKVFLSDGPNIRNSLQQALESKDAQQLREAAHSAKGAVGNFCNEDAVAAALCLENACKNGVQEQFLPLTQTLQAKIIAVENALREGLETL